MKGTFVEKTVSAPHAATADGTGVLDSLLGFGCGLIVYHTVDRSSFSCFS
jgi:hypothetical protein